ncbi:MAG: peptidoglycan recognition family protein, partial [Oscillospiraceae bacterium]
LRRYVQPDDGALGRNNNHNDWNNPKEDVCVHGFIGKLLDGSVGVYQTLPWDMRGWHAYFGPHGSANNTHISFEICEDGLQDAVYFNAVYRAAVELTAHLCREFGLDPMADGVVICHSEGYRRGIASNHGDVMHWFPRFGKTMDDFRADVKNEMEGGIDVTETELKQLVKDAVARELADRDEAAAKAAQNVSAWAKADWDAACRAKLFDGTRPGGAMTREMTACVLARTGKV